MGSAKRGVVFVGGLLAAGLVRALVRHRQEIFGTGRGSTLFLGLTLVAVVGFIILIGRAGARKTNSHLEELTLELGWLPGGQRRLNDDSIVREWEGKRVGLSYWEAASPGSEGSEAVRISLEASFKVGFSLVRRSYAEAPASFGFGPAATVKDLALIFRMEGTRVDLERLVAETEILVLLNQILSVPEDELVLDRSGLRLKCAVGGKVLPPPPPTVFAVESRQPVDALVFAMWDVMQRLYRLYSV